MSSEPLCRASVALKKHPGSLTLTKPDPKGKRAVPQQLVWTPENGTDGQLKIDAGTLKCTCRSSAQSDATALFASKEGGAKVMIRVAVALPSGAEEMHNFTSAGTAHFPADASASCPGHRPSAIASTSSAIWRRSSRSTARARTARAHRQQRRTERPRLRSARVPRPPDQPRHPTSTTRP